MLVMIDENGVADVYDDTYDIVIHCENEEDQKDARLALKNVRRWVPVTERLPKLGEYVLISFSNFSVPAIGRYDPRTKRAEHGLLEMRLNHSSARTFM